MSIETLFPKKLKTTQYATTGQYVNKLWYIYSNTKLIKKCLIHTTWVDLKNIALSKRARQKTINSIIILFIGNFTKLNLIYRGIKLINGCLWPGVRRELLLQEHRELFEAEELFCIYGGYQSVYICNCSISWFSDGYPNVYIFQNSLKCTPKIDALNVCKVYPNTVDL